MAAPRFEAGDKVVFCRSKRNRDIGDTTIGKIYDVLRDHDGAYYIDDVGDTRWWPLEPFTDHKPTKIIA